MFSLDSLDPLTCPTFSFRIRGEAVAFFEETLALTSPLSVFRLLLDFTSVYNPCSPLRVELITSRQIRSTARLSLWLNGSELPRIYNQDLLNNLFRHP